MAHPSLAVYVRIWPYMTEFGRPVTILDHKKLPTLGELLNHDMPPNLDLNQIYMRQRRRELSFEHFLTVFKFIKLWKIVEIVQISILKGRGWRSVSDGQSPMRL